MHVAIARFRLRAAAFSILDGDEHRVDDVVATYR
jgi:hypothetical protein